VHGKDPNKGRLMLAVKEVKDWCTKNRTDYSAMLEYLRECGALISSHEKLRLTRGTDVSGGQCWCIVINTTKLDDALDSIAPAVSLVVNNTRSNVAVQDSEHQMAVGDV
jgi:hypothetical protein